MQELNSVKGSGGGQTWPGCDAGRESGSLVLRNLKTMLRIHRFLSRGEA